MRDANEHQIKAGVYMLRVVIDGIAVTKQIVSVEKQLQISIL